ncbi:cartilage-associated protein-like isoform X2 [Periplaneta americana]|uniref:cartilage-associated protein-like isoform X2 n=1 Tax=Periplaneta americana TaxID=6978 RepID=UPI0037E98F6A
MATSIADVCVFVRATKMCMLVLLCVCFFVDNHVLSQTGIETDEKTCDVLYRDGVEAYLDERWQECVDNLERALSSYRVLKHTTVNCRLKCQSEAEESAFMDPRNIEDLHFYDKMIRKTLCLLRCNKHDPKGGLNPIPRHVEQEFEDLKPYEYLQLCYYQTNMLQKAASAVFTFLVTHPDNEVMRDNLQFYSNLPEVNIDSVENFEAREYVSLYIRGSDAYQHEDYKAVIRFIEESLEDILRAEEECRAYCEGPFDQGWYPDFVSSIANHFTYCLKCKRRCPDKLKSLNGEEHHDLLPSHYHFLQYAYYKVGDMKKACKAVASYLLFFPGDETMLNNKDYYLKLPKVQKEYFTPREEAVKYVERMEYENKLIHFIETEFVFQDSTRNGTEDKIVKKSSVAKPKDNFIIAAISKLQLFPPPVVKFEWPKYETNTKLNTEEKVKKYKKIRKEKNDYNRGAKNPDEKKMQDDIRKRKKRAVEQMQRAAARNITAVMGEKNLHGKYRFVAEGFANSSDCNKLMELAQIAAVQGDGYSDNKSPHTNFERFEGVSLGRAALLVYLGLIEAEMLELYLGLSELGRDYVERYFNLKSELYFTYTHLVCRSALRDFKKCIIHGDSRGKVKN